MRRYIRLRAVLTGAEGFARLEVSAERIRIQVSVRGLKARARGLRVFLREAGGEPNELGAARINAQGCATLETSVSRRQWRAAPERMQALLIVADDSEATPLFYGLCAQASAQSLAQAQAALRKLCARLNGKACMPKASAEAAQPEPPEPSEPPREKAACAPERAEKSLAGKPYAPELLPCRPERAPSAPCGSAKPRMSYPLRAPRRALRRAFAHDARLTAIDPDAYAEPLRAQSREETLAREENALADAYYEAIEPERYVPCFRAAACERPPTCAEVAPPAVRARPVDSLPALCYPGALCSLRPLFETRVPFSPFGEKGWRYVRVALRDGGCYAVGIRVIDACVCGVAYALEGEADAPPPDRAYRWRTGDDGKGYWVLRRGTETERTVGGVAPYDPHKD